jgi:hypothetical protein
MFLLGPQIPCVGQMHKNGGARVVGKSVGPEVPMENVGGGKL